MCSPKKEWNFTKGDFEKLKELYEQAVADIETVKMRLAARKKEPVTDHSPKYFRLSSPAYSNSIWELVDFIEDKISYTQGNYTDAGNRACENQELIRNADLTTVRLLSKYFVRMEHWCTYGWVELVETGFLAAIIKRLEELIMSDSGSVEE